MPPTLAYHARVDTVPVPPSPTGAPATPPTPAVPHLGEPAERPFAAQPDPRDGSPEPATSADSLAATTAELDAVDAVLGAVEAALARLDAGTYGTCEVCHRPLADDLLASHPTATRCEECAEESRLGVDGKPAV